MHMVFCFLLLFASCVYALDNGAGKTPPLGWSTWCSNGRCGNDYCDESSVLESANVLIQSGMHKLGWEYVVLDDCWLNSRDASGVLKEDPHRFPSGMQKLTENLHNLGLKFGLYTSAGNATCNSHGQGHAVPGSEDHYQEDSNLFASWGIDYVKFDWCGDVKHHPLASRDDYKLISKAVTNTSPARVLFFECVGGYPFLLTSVGKYCNTWRVWEDHHDNWESTQKSIEAQDHLGLTGKPGAWSYMDVLTTGGQGCELGSQAHCPGQTDVEYITEFSLWSLTQSPLFIATDIRNMTDLMKLAFLNKPILDLHQDTRTLPGKRLLDWPCSEFGACQVWSREVADGSKAVVLYNKGTKSHRITAEFRHFGWSKSDKINVFNVWTNEHSISQGSFAADVEAHGVVFVFLSLSNN